MSQRLALLLLGLPLVIIGVFLFFFLQQKQPQVETPQEVLSTSTPEPATTMKIESPAFQHNERIPAKYACDAENVSPPLTIADVPTEARTLVLIMDDPDAPRGTLRPGSGQAWVHWTVWNIAPDTASIPENSVPAGAVEGVTSFGKPGYGGPCPPSGTHRYFFKLYALDTTLDLPATTDKAKLEETMQGHILAQTELVGLYQRQ